MLTYYRRANSQLFVGYQQCVNFFVPLREHGTFHVSGPGSASRHFRRIGRRGPVLQRCRFVLKEPRSTFNRISLNQFPLDDE